MPLEPARYAIAPTAWRVRTIKAGLTTNSKNSLQGDRGQEPQWIDIDRGTSTSGAKLTQVFRDMILHPQQGTHNGKGNAVQSARVHWLPCSLASLCSMSALSSPRDEETRFKLSVQVQVMSLYFVEEPLLKVVIVYCAHFHVWSERFSGKGLQETLHQMKERRATPFVWFLLLFAWLGRENKTVQIIWKEWFRPLQRPPSVAM